MDNRWIPLKTASQETGKSISTLRRLLKKHNIPTETKSRVIYLDKRHLLQVLANEYPQTTQVTSQTASLLEPKEEHIVSMLKEQVADLKAEKARLLQKIDNLELKIEQLERQKEALNQENKALLRQPQPKKQQESGLIDGIAGLLGFIRDK